MNRLMVFVLIFIFSVATVGCSTTPLEPPTDQKPPQNTVPPQEPSNNSPDTSSETPKTKPAKETQVNIYLIALNDKGKSGKDIGTGDSLVAVKRKITTPQTPLKAAFEELLALKEQYYGQSGLYNALYRSNLKLVNATITNGNAEIYLSGTLSLGGVMDNPRVENQLTGTALQFPTVNKVQVYLNDKPLKDALSLK